MIHPRTNSTSNSDTPESSNSDAGHEANPEKSANARTEPRIYAGPMTVHLTRPDGSVLCPEALERDAMSDGEFWEHVLLGPLPPFNPFDEEDLDDRDFLPDRAGQPCPECGSVGPCAWDLEGRALIHAVGDDDGDD